MWIEVFLESDPFKNQYPYGIDLCNF